MKESDKESGGDADDCKVGLEVWDNSPSMLWTSVPLVLMNSDITVHLYIRKR